MRSRFLQLSTFDFLKAALISVFTGGLAAIITILDAGSVPTILQLKTVALASVCSLVSYLLKNTLTNSEGKILTKEPVKK